MVCLEMVCDRKSFYSFAFNIHLCFNDTFSARKNVIVAHRKSSILSFPSIFKLSTVCCLTYSITLLLPLMARLFSKDSLMTQDS